LMDINSEAEVDKQTEIVEQQTGSMNTLQALVKRSTKELAQFEEDRPNLIELAQMREELERLKNASQKKLQDRTYVRVIDIDGKDGSISFFDENKDPPVSIM